MSALPNYERNYDRWGQPWPWFPCSGCLRLVRYDEATLLSVSNGRGYGHPACEGRQRAERGWR